MTQVDASPPSPVVVPLYTRRAWFQGGLFAFMTLFFSLPFVPFALIGGHWDIVFWAACGILVFCALPAVYFLGLALAKPVALRMDQNGVSGYFSAPAQWHEITDVGLADNHQKQQVLGFRLADPIAFRARQTPWQRLMSHSNGRGVGYHLLFPGPLLKGADMAQLLAQAQQFKATARGLQQP